ncbi:MAG: hypothetical protein KAS23_12315, partial [Anaerohalosphaera sp.]|nr:hypothetical protein [Anaerohalosphaera sp.]
MGFDMRRVLVVSVALICFYGIGIEAGATALDDYVAVADGHYSKTDDDGVFDFGTLTQGYVVELTSQQWRGPGEVDHPVWKHWVTIVVPRGELFLGPVKDTALILINGGNVGDTAPVIDPQYRLLAAGTRSVLVILEGVPNQPLTFSDEGFSRSEDEIIAYSWDKFLRGGDAYWPVQLPMVKSVVMCMDMVQEFVWVKEGKTINNFVLTGGSKRGWTAWLTAAVDNRVTAIAPIVSDLLNMKRSFSHHWAVYGFWAEALAPYEDMGIFEWFDEPEVDALLEIVDPFEYLDRLDMPKYIVNAAGDDFFVSDSIQFYIDDLAGETYLRHVPNCDHYLTGKFEDVLEGMAPYYDALLNGEARPDFSWSLEDDGAIRVESVDVAKEVNLWQLTNSTSRDLRLTTTGANWVSSPLSDQGGGVYIGQVAEPAEGWTAFFVELKYESSFIDAASYDYCFTTEMRVVPEVRPFEADFSRDGLVSADDFMIFADVWLSDNA